MMISACSVARRRCWEGIAAMATPDLTVTRGEVSVVEIHRPPNNYLDHSLVRELADALQALAASDTRAVVLCSEGKNFCAGANLRRRDPSAIKSEGTHLYDEALRCFEQDLPIVAAVQGSAVGAGLGLALLADFRVGAPETRWAANFARLGFHQGFGISLTLPRVVGQQHAYDLLFTGRRVEGQEAFRIGLCDRLVGQHELLPAAHALAEEIAESAPLAIRSIRATLRAHFLSSLRGVVAAEREAQEALARTADFREGVAAVAERRRPAFRGL